MTIPASQHGSRSWEPTIHMLHELNIPIHRLGYKQLHLAIPRYAQDDTQSFTKELYPYVAAHWGHSNWQTVEHTIRMAILYAWEHRDPQVWEQYFPNSTRPPSNKQFIVTLAERLE